MSSFNTAISVYLSDWLGYFPNSNLESELRHYLHYNFATKPTAIYPILISVFRKSQVGNYVYGSLFNIILLLDLTCCLMNWIPYGRCKLAKYTAVGKW